MTTRTDLEDALTRAAEHLNSALLSELAARITDYREAHAERTPSPGTTTLAIHMAGRALLAFVRGGETPNNTEHTTDG